MPQRGGLADFEPLVAPLFAPADRPDRFAKAAVSGADAIIIDLEDAVAPGQKSVARSALGAARDVPTRVFVRINAPGTPWHDDDLAALRVLPSAGIVLPKASGPRQILEVDRKLGPGRPFIALIESAGGLVNALAIAETPCVRQLAFGPVDYALDLFISPNPEASAHALAAITLASRAGGLPGPLDGPCLALTDHDMLASEIARARRLGAAGKLCVHPYQICKVVEGFAPTFEELSRARQILAAGEDGGAKAVAGALVDRPIVQWAQRTVARAAGDLIRPG